MTKDYVMDRESLKKHCEMMCERYKNVPASGAYGEHRLVLDLLEQVEWIPTSEREPEEYGEYFITWTTSSFDHPLIAICEGEVTWEWDDEKNRWKFEWLLEDYIKAYPNVKVTAWRPLGEPYKGE